MLVQNTEGNNPCLFRSLFQTVSSFLFSNTPNILSVLCWSSTCTSYYHENVRVHGFHKQIGTHLRTPRCWMSFSFSLGYFSAWEADNNCIHLCRSCLVHRNLQTFTVLQCLYNCKLLCSINEKRYIEE